MVISFLSNYLSVKSIKHLHIEKSFAILFIEYVVRLTGWALRLGQRRYPWDFLNVEVLFMWQKLDKEWQW